jgi:preprotein translocase subunit SecB
MTEENPNAEASENQQFNILRVYVKDVSFEAPNSPRIFVEDFKPQVHVEMSTRTANVDENLYEVVLKVTVSAKEGEKTGFLVEVEQAGIFQIQVADDERLTTILEASCPKNLFPFAREAISDLVVKGGFPQLLLAPVNFHVIHQQKNAAKNQQTIAE